MERWRQDMDKVFKALADAGRRRLLDSLHTSNGQTLGQLCEHLEMSRQAVSKHLKLLEEANLVATETWAREVALFESGSDSRNRRTLDWQIRTRPPASPGGTQTKSRRRK